MLIHKLQLENGSGISCMALTKQRNYLLAGNSKGHISVYDLKTKGKEKLINIISQI